MVARSDARPPGADVRGFDHVVILSFGHEIMSTAILSLPLIQEGQLSVTGERMKECALSTGKLPRRLAQNSVDRLTDRARNDLKRP